MEMGYQWMQSGENPIYTKEKSLVRRISMYRKKKKIYFHLILEHIIITTC
jgi:hypothetical protein